MYPNNPTKMAPLAQQHNDNEASSWRQRSKLEKVADLPQELEDELDKLDKLFWVSAGKLKAIVKRFGEELDDGLSKNNQNIPMNIGWTGLPTGSEKGTILTIDLGGTNLRVCSVTLHGDTKDAQEKSELDQEQYKLPEDLKTGEAEGLWNFIAEKLDSFVKSRKLDQKYTKEKPMPLGFTFSYPARQDRIDHAVLQTWTKGFDIKGVEGEDAAYHLREKMESKGLPFELICVINDTVGAMIASAYIDPSTIIGAIFGTGCNAAYMASLSSIKKLKKGAERTNDAQNGKSDGRMAINCEYGAFDNERRVLPVTSYDKQIDQESPRPGEQAFEKLSAGLYLGEIFRLILLGLADRGLIFKDQDTKQLHESYSIDTGFLANIEVDGSPKLSTTRDLFASKLNLTPTDVEIELSRRLAEIIAVRGARLCACGIAAICAKEGLEKGNVAADGSVANKDPNFKERWGRALGEILDWKEEWKDGASGPIGITSAEDGSGIGCAIIAAMEIEKRNRET